MIPLDLDPDQARRLEKLARLKGRAVYTRALASFAVELLDEALRQELPRAEAIARARRTAEQNR